MPLFYNRYNWPNFNSIVIKFWDQGVLLVKVFHQPENTCIRCFAIAMLSTSGFWSLLSVAVGSAVLQWLGGLLWRALFKLCKILLVFLHTLANALETQTSPTDAVAPAPASPPASHAPSPRPSQSPTRADNTGKAPASAMPPASSSPGPSPTSNCSTPANKHQTPACPQGPGPKLPPHSQSPSHRLPQRPRSSPSPPEVHRPRGGGQRSMGHKSTAA